MCYRRSKRFLLLWVSWLLLSSAFLLFVSPAGYSAESPETLDPMTAQEIAAELRIISELYKQSSEKYEVALMKLSERLGISVEALEKSIQSLRMHVDSATKQNSESIDSFRDYQEKAEGRITALEHQVRFTRTIAVAAGSAVLVLVAVEVIQAVIPP